VNVLARVGPGGCPQPDTRRISSRILIGTAAERIVLREERFRSQIVVPIRLAALVRGALILRTKERNAYTSDDGEALARSPSRPRPELRMRFSVRRCCVSATPKWSGT
jgi:hypothetical protein